MYIFTKFNQLVDFYFPPISMLTLYYINYIIVDTDQIKCIFKFNILE